MLNKIKVAVCNVVANKLTTVAEMATNSVSLFSQYEHEMPKQLKK